MVPLVAVIEAHFEFDALRDLHLEPVRLREAEAVDQEGMRLVERSRREHRVPEPDAFGEEPARHAADDANGVDASSSASTTSTGTPQGVDVRAKRFTRRARRSSSDPSVTSMPVRASRAATASNASSSTASKPRNTASLAGPGRDDHPVGFVVVAPRQCAVVGRLSGNEPDDLAEEWRECCGVRHLDADVCEFDLSVACGCPLGSASEEQQADRGPRALRSHSDHSGRVR